MSKATPHFALVSICIALSCSGLNAQTPPASPDISASSNSDNRDRSVYSIPTSSGLPKKFVTNLLLDQKDIWTSPFHTDRRDAKWWILAGVGTAGLLAADHRASQTLPFSGTSVRAGSDLSRAGQWYSVFPAAAAMYVAGSLTESPKLKWTGIESLEALADADIAVNVLKVVARRQRPGDGDHGGHFEKGGSSFPSGHSTQAWALASVISDEYGEHKWIPVVAYGYATTVSVSRALAQAHVTSDVFVGGVIGFFIGHYVVHTQRLHQNHGASKSQLWRMPTSIAPSFGPGVSLSVRFSLAPESISAGLDN